jgi:hypothetical protein
MQSRRDWETIVYQGLGLAAPHRSETEYLQYLEEIQGIEDTEVILFDEEDEVKYSKTLGELPSLGNKSARLARFIGLA